MNRFNFGSETHNLAAIIAGGRWARQQSCKSSSSSALHHLREIMGKLKLAVKDLVREPDAGDLHVRFDEAVAGVHCLKVRGIASILI